MVRTLRRLTLALIAGLFHAVVARGAESLRVLLVAPDRPAAIELTALNVALRRSFGFDGGIAGLPGDPKARSPLAALRAVDAAIFFRGPGALLHEDAALLLEFLGSGKGVVVVGAVPEAWPPEVRIQEDILGAARGEMFAGGAAMRVVTLFPHAIFTGVTRFETDQPVALFTQLGEDAQMIMEGTVGEATAPLGWVRQRPAGRMCHLVPAGAALFDDEAYRRMVGNAVLWTTRRSIPGAQAAVQRTFMPDAHPGAFAITLPDGPGICLDPVRGGINYIWDGDFVDLRPRWITKQGEPARIFGAIFYREAEWQPIRAGAPHGKSGYQFRGYTWRADGPEFHYLVGGREVNETFSALPGGAGLIRRFRVGAGAPLWINLESQSGAEVRLRGLERDGQLACFASREAGGFAIEIHRMPERAR